LLSLSSTFNFNVPIIAQWLTKGKKMSERDTSLIPDDLDQDTYDAARYLLLRERYPRSMEDIANEFGISRQGLYRRLDRWERTGALEKAREVLLVPMVEEIRAANDEVVRRWP